MTASRKDVASTSPQGGTRLFAPLLIGQGKLAQHLFLYLTQQKIPFQTWANARDLKPLELGKLLGQVNAAWILVSDQAIAEVASRIRELAPHLPILHSSAATPVPGTLTIHPLQTFGPDLYDSSTYQKIPLILVREEWENHAELKAAIGSVLPNPVSEISMSERVMYHAYCVMMANFPQLLWARVSAESSNKLNLNLSQFAPILTRATENFLKSGPRALTGPLVRGDQATISRHLEVLQGSDLLPIYQSFVDLFSKTKDLKKENSSHDYRS